ncbi:unnamed protein product [Ectocarpus sp. CCAP 1310/34]|nr:unnamed protein product [Ectocarpus sp. CCAP 1310/34]
MDVHQTATRVRQSLTGLGVHLQLDWVKHCLEAGGGMDPGVSGNGQRQQSEAQEGVYRTFLACDLREAGEACLPAGVGSMVKERVKGKMVVQVENARDIAKNLEQREKVDGSSAHHTLKLALGDGRQTVAAFEYKRVQGLVADPPLGLKLLLVEPWVRRGILLLSSENTTVLGGEVSSLVEAREAARAGGAQSTANAATNTTNNDDTVEPRTSRNQPGEPAGRTATDSGAAGNSGPRARAPQNATRAQAESGGRPRPPQPGGSHRRDENADPSGVVDLSSSSSSSGSNLDTLLSSQGRRDADAEGQQRSRSASGKGGVVGSSRPSRSEFGVFNPYAAATGPGSTPGRSAAAPTRARVRNPYSASTLSATSSAAETAGTARSKGQQGAARSTSPDSSGGQGRPRGGATRVSAFQDLEDDDGPRFEYLEEPDFDDEEHDNEPPEEAATAAAAAAAVRTGRNPGMLSDPSRVSASTESSSPTAAAVAPRPKIVSARVQKEKLRQEQEEKSRKRSRGQGEGGDSGGGDGEVADIEGEFGGGGRSRTGLEVSARRKRGRSSSEIGSRGGDRERRNDTRPSPPSGPYTSLEDLDRLAAAGGGMYRVKAVVSDTKNCKIRKKKYLLVVEIEDGTAVVSVRLSEQITRRLFGVEAREFKKIFQADPEKAISIQTRVEKEIREMEGVMAIQISAGATSSQSPATPGAAISQNSATGDSEWGLPMVVSVKPPTDGDCHELLSRVTSLL